MKLTMDEKEELEDLLHHKGMAAFWKVAEDSLGLIYNDVLKLHLSPSNREDLFLLKARSEGSAQLLSSLKQRLVKYKSE